MASNRMSGRAHCARVARGWASCRSVLWILCAVVHWAAVEAPLYAADCGVRVHTRVDAQVDAQVEAQVDAHGDGHGDGHGAIVRRCRSLRALDRVPEIERDAFESLVREALMSAEVSKQSNLRAQEAARAGTDAPLLVSAVVSDRNANLSALSVVSAERLLTESMIPDDPNADLLVRESLLSRLHPTRVLAWKDIVRAVHASALSEDPRADRDRIRLFGAWGRSGVLDQGTFNVATESCDALQSQTNAWIAWHARYSEWLHALVAHGAADRSAPLKCAALQLHVMMRTHGDVAGAKVEFERALRAFAKQLGDPALASQLLRVLLEGGVAKLSHQRVVEATASAERRFLCAFARAGIEVAEVEAWMTIAGIELPKEPPRLVGPDGRVRTLDRRLERLERLGQLERMPRSNLVASREVASSDESLVRSSVGWPVAWRMASRMGSFAPSRTASVVASLTASFLALSDYAVADAERRLHPLSPPDAASELRARWTGAPRAFSCRDHRLRCAWDSRRGAVCASGSGRDHDCRPRPCRLHESPASNTLHRSRCACAATQSGGSEGATRARELHSSSARVGRGVWAALSAPHHRGRDPPR